MRLFCPGVIQFFLYLHLGKRFKRLGFKDSVSCFGGKKQQGDKTNYSCYRPKFLWYKRKPVNSKKSLYFLPNPGMRNIIYEIQKGNKESLKEFFYDFHPVLCAFAERYLKDPDKSKDVAQEAFIKFWSRRHEFSGLSHAKAFLYTVARNSSLNILKRASRDEPVSRIEQLEADCFFKKNIIEKETYALLRSSIERLPERMRTIIEYSMQGLKNHEIASCLDISAHTVHTTKKVAYKKLRVFIKDLYFLFF